MMETTAVVVAIVPSVARQRPQRFRLSAHVFLSRAWVVGRVCGDTAWTLRGHAPQAGRPNPAGPTFEREHAVTEVPAEVRPRVPQQQQEDPVDQREQQRLDAAQVVRAQLMWVVKIVSHSGAKICTPS